MAGEMFQQQQKNQQPIQITREEEKLVTSGQLQQEQQIGDQQMVKQEQAMSAESTKIMKGSNFSDVDDSDPLNPAMQFADEQQREWYDRRNAARM